MIADTWNHVIAPQYYAAFSWSLLNSVVDTSVQPPRLRHFDDVPHILKMENDAVLQ